MYDVVYVDYKIPELVQRRRYAEVIFVDLYHLTNSSLELDVSVEKLAPAPVSGNVSLLD